MTDIKIRLQEFQTTFFGKIKEVIDETQLEALRIEYLGRNGVLANMMTNLKELSSDDKRTYGPLINDLKKQAQTAFDEKKQSLLDEQAAQRLLQTTQFDVTAYKPSSQGSLHPYTHIIEHIESIVTSMGFMVAEGPEVETPFYNFEALNIPEDHPAREMHDTFWLTVPGQLMRTHTSSVQIHTLQNNKPPIAICVPGRAYRHEATDATHDFVFMQCEVLVIDKNISLANLVATIKTFMQALFEKETLDIRVRPSFFPFVEPGLEVDITCPFCTNGCSVCKKRGWIELGGAGLVHPNVLTACGLNPKEWGGFAWGLGIERLAMLKYQIQDIRLLKTPKLDFLRQF